MSVPDEFDCIDCGIHVYRYAGQADNDDHVCLECAFLRTLPEEDRATIQAHLHWGKGP